MFRVIRVPIAVTLLFAQTLVLGAEEPLGTVIDRAAAYVADYHERLAMVVAQERYEQEVRYPAPINARLPRDDFTTTVLVSDFLLVRGPGGGWYPFRDVFERDGTAVRDREERLSALFLENPETAFDLAGRIAQESSRYNIGNVIRNVNVPTLPLEFLGPDNRGRFEFEFDGSATAGVRVVRYRERDGPTSIKTTNNRDLPVSGRYWIEERTGRIQRSELRASDSTLDARITVTYHLDEAVGFWVPERMEEQYSQKNDSSQIRGTALYSKYRRFQITTSDEMVK